MQILPEEGSVFGRIGKGLGQGLGEAIPKVVERHQLSSGLKKLANQPQSSNVFEQAGNLAGIPGMTPEMLHHYLPLLQQQQQRQAFSQNESNKGQIPQANQNGSMEQTNEPVEIGRRSSKYLIPSSAQEIDSEVAKLASDPRYVGKSPDELRSIAQERDTRRVASDQALESRLDVGNKRFDSRFNEKQISNLGEYISKYRDEVADLIERGMNPTKAAEEVSTKALDFDKAKTRFDTLAAQGLLAHKPNDLKAALKSIRKQYEKAGALEAFSNDLISKEDMSHEYANYLAFPPKENKELSNFIESQKAREPKVHPTGVGAAIVSKEKPIVEQSIEVARNAMKHITDKDSLDAIAIELGKKGFNENAVMREFKRAYANDELKLTERQAGETQKTPTWLPKLADLFVFTLADEEI